MAELSGWGYRIKITVDNTNIDSDLTQFPVPIILGTSVGQSSQDMSCVFDSIGVNYLKIAVTKADGTTQIYGEVEQWDSVNEKALVWVAKSDLVIASASVTELYIYYDPTHANNTTYIGVPGDAVVQHIWDSYFKAVYHMAQDPSGGAGCIFDSTSSGADGTPGGGLTASGDLIDGDYGKALQFDDADNDYLEVTNDCFSITGAITVEGIAALDAAGGSDYARIFHKGTIFSKIVGLWVDSSGTCMFRINGGSNATGSIPSFSLGTYYYLVGRYDPSGDGVIRVQADLTEIGTTNETDAITAGTDTFIGNADSSRGWDGPIREVRVSNVKRSDDWLKAICYSNVDDLLTFGEPEQLNLRSILESCTGGDLLSDNIGVIVEAGVGSATLFDNIGGLSESIVGSGILSPLKPIPEALSESASGTASFAAFEMFAIDFQGSGSGTAITSAAKETIGAISESGDGSDSFLPRNRYPHDLSEITTIWDYPLSSWLRTIAESITSTDAIELQLLVRVSEYLQLKETLITKWDGVEVISDSVVIRDVVGLIQAIDETISESITATDVPSALTCLLVREYIELKETVGDNLSISRSIAEAITATDSVVSSWIRTLTETITATDSVNALLSLLISENITVAEALSAVGTFSRGLAEMITATDSVSRAFDLSASETLSVVDASTAMASFFKSIAETVTSTDTVAGTNTIAITTTEAITLVDTVVSGATMYLSVTDGVLLGATVEIDDEIYECFVLNTPSFFPSVYSGFDFNSYCVYQSRAFGANGTGIFELDGATDNGESISSGVMTHETDFGARNKKRFRKAYIGLDGTGAKMVMETGEGERKVYDIDGKGMVDASKVIQGREWVLSVTDFDELKSLKLIPVILARGK